MPRTHYAFFGAYACGTLCEGFSDRFLKRHLEETGETPALFVAPQPTFLDQLNRIGLKF